MSDNLLVKRNSN